MREPTIDELAEGDLMPSTVMRRRAQRKADYAALKAGPCVFCDSTAPQQQMCLIHRPGEPIRFKMSDHADYRWEEVLIEAARCMLVCYNCLGLVSKYSQIGQTHREIRLIPPAGRDFSEAEKRAIRLYLQSNLIL